MESLLTTSEYFGIFITIAIFLACTWLKNKTKINVLNPLLVSTIVIIAILCIFDIEYETYNRGAKYLSYFFVKRLLFYFDYVIIFLMFYTYTHVSASVRIYFLGGYKE